MAGVDVLGGSWGKQKPPLGTPIDLGHPLARGLAGAWAAAPCLADATTGKAAGVLGAVGATMSPLGLGWTFAAGTNALTLPSAAFQSAAISGVFGIVTDSAGSDQDHQTVFSMGAAGSVYEVYFSVGGGAPNLFTGTAGSWLDGSGGVAALAPTIVGFSTSAAGRAVYAGGVAVGANSGAYAPNGGTTTALLGRRVDGGGFAPQYLGRIAFAYLWSRSLAAPEHLALALDPYAIFAPPRRLWGVLAAAAAAFDPSTSLVPSFAATPPRPPPAVVPY